MQNSTPDASLLIVILTYNSAGVVERTVRAAQQVGSQVLVVDSHSADNTRDLATALGCTVVTRAFKHYADQRNWAIQEHGSAYTWQLHLDADEVLSEQAIASLRSALANPRDCDGFLLKRLTYFMDKPLHWAGENSWHMRLFRSGTGACEDRLYDQHFIWTARHNRWSDLEAGEVARPVDNPGKLQGELSSDPRKRIRLYKGAYYKLPRIWRSLAYFLFRYVLLMGFLDGRTGFYYCFFQSLWFRLLVDAKLDEGAASQS